MPRRGQRPGAAWWVQGKAMADASFGRRNYRPPQGRKHMPVPVTRRSRESRVVSSPAIMKMNGRSIRHRPPRRGRALWRCCRVALLLEHGTSTYVACVAGSCPRTKGSSRPTLNSRALKVSARGRTIGHWYNLRMKKNSIRRKTHRLLAAGKLTKQACQCGATETQAHHVDYKSASAIKWLCRHCHEQEHRRISGYASSAWERAGLAARMYFAGMPLKDAVQASS